MFQKIAVGTLAFVLSIVFIVTAAGRVAAQGWEKALPELAAVTVAAVAYAFGLRLLGGLCFAQLRNARLQRIASLALQYSVSVAAYVGLIDLALQPEWTDSAMLLSDLSTFLAAHAFACFFLLVWRVVDLLVER